MNFSYENLGTNTYLVYTVPEEEKIDSMTMGMLSNNKIPGLAGTLFTQMDSTKYIKYNVSAHIPVSQFFAGAVNKKRLLGVFKGVVSAILSAEDYMIDESAILLDLDYIFADVTTCETVLICLPIEHEAKRHDLGAFFKSIMFGTQFDQTENCDYVAKIINYLNSSPLFSLNDFNDLLDKIEQSGTSAAQYSQPKVVQEPQIQEKVESKPVVQPQERQPMVPPKKPENHLLGANQNPAGGAKPANGGSAPVIPPVPNQQSAEPAKSKGFSLFGFLSSNDKKDTKAQPAKQPAKQPPQAATKPAFEVPGQPAAPKMAFEVPGQPAPQAAAIPQPVKPQPVMPQQAPAPQHVQPKAPVQQPVIQKPVVSQPAYVQPNIPQGQPLNFGETTVLGGGGIGETTVLGAAPVVQVKPHLIRAKNNERIDLNKPVFRIGKEKSYVDYFVGDNSAISRSHANIISRDGEYFVVDTNSTNHTYVNGQMIQSNVETKIVHGSKIRLANEDFELKLY